MSKIGRFGDFGGQYVPETVMRAVNELNEAYDHYKNDPQFIEELNALYRDYAGRPSMLYYAEKMTKDLGGAKIYIKREDLNHTGSHKINNVLGQMLLAKKMGKKRIIAETGAGQHGVATATVAALFGLECEIYMGATDVERQSLGQLRRERHQNPQGRGQRGLPRLGDEHRKHLLPHRIGHGASSLSHYGPGFPENHRH